MAEFEFLRAGNSEATEKKALNALFASASGVLSGLVVTQTSTASGSVLIASGAALVHPSAVSASLLGNDTSKTLDVFTANPVGGLPRNDIVEFDQITATISVRVGTPNATPTDPTVPNTSVALARLRHAASATTIPTAKIDTLIVATTLRGVVPPDDTGWITPVLGSGWTVASGDTPQYRRLNGIVYMRGRASSSGSTAIIFTLPVGFQQSAAGIIFLAEVGGATMRCQVIGSSVRQVTTATATSLSLGSFLSFPADA